MKVSHYQWKTCCENSLIRKVYIKSSHSEVRLMFRIRLQLMIIFSTNQLIGQTNRCIMLDRLRISVTESRLPSRRKLSLPLRFCLLSQHRSLTMILHIHRNVVRPSWWSNKESSYSTLLNWCYKTGNECLTFSYFSMQKRNKRNLFDGGLVGADSLIATVGMIQWQEWTLTKADSSGGAVHTLSMEVFNVWWEEKEVRPIVPRSTSPPVPHTHWWTKCKVHQLYL